MTPIGSRRIQDVKPSMYSVVALPSSTRAAPAKKRIWSHIGGISSLRVSPFGLPVFSASTSTSCSAFSSMASAILSRQLMRSLGVVSRQPPSNAASAAFIAASMSASPDFGEVA